MVDKKKKKDQETGRPELILPKNNIVSHKFAKTKPFKPSYEKCGTEDMNLIMSWEYSRMWHKEVDRYLRDRSEQMKPKGFKKFEPKPRPKLGKKEEKIVEIKKFKNVQSRQKKQTKGKQKEVSCECKAENESQPKENIPNNNENEKIDCSIPAVASYNLDGGCQCGKIADRTYNCVFIDTKPIASQTIKNQMNTQNTVQKVDSNQKTDPFGGVCVCKPKSNDKPEPQTNNGRKVINMCLCSGQQKPELQPNNRNGKITVACCKDHAEEVCPSQSATVKQLDEEKPSQPSPPEAKICVFKEGEQTCSCGE